MRCNQSNIHTLRASENCHYLQTANGAVVGFGQPTLPSQLPLYCAANFLTLQPAL